MVPTTCAADTTTAELDALVSANNNSATFYFDVGIDCASVDTIWQATDTDIDHLLYCGFQEASVLPANA